MIISNQGFGVSKTLIYKEYWYIIINTTQSFLLLIFIIATVFTGCTKSESTIHEGDIKDYVYVAEQEAFADKNYIQGICSYEDKLYMTTYHQQTGSNRTYVIDCLSKQIKPFFCH